jgi:hypothetical protein
VGKAGNGLTLSPMNDSATPVPVRSRPIYALWIGLVIAAGLASRRWGYLLPAILRKNAGDGLWALMVFLLIGFALPRRSTLWTAGVATVISVLDEFSQMYHAPWIDSIRATTAGHLILGSDFAWTDILDYLIGIAIGIAAELLMKRRFR